MSALVVWFSGLPASGKSALATQVRDRLVAADAPALLLDGDEVRAALVPAPGYEPEARAHFYATLGNLAALLAGQGAIVLVAATAHRRDYRDRARRAAPLFLEVWVRTPLAECERRDTKGLFARARAGTLKHVPGIDEPFEAPVDPDVVSERGAGEAEAEAVVAAVRDTLGR